MKNDSKAGQEEALERQSHNLDDIPSAHTLSHPNSENELITSVRMKGLMIDVANMQIPGQRGDCVSKPRALSRLF
jgi:hypothetical protein